MIVPKDPAHKVLVMDARGNYTAYNDTSHLLKGHIMIKKITTVIKENKTALGKRALIIGGTVVGAIIAGVLISKSEPDTIESIVIEEDLVEEEPTTEAPEEN